MQESVSVLTLEFLTWVSSRPRTYAQAMEAWRTTCPRHSVWEDAMLGGLIQLESGTTINQSKVTLTPLGRAILDRNSSRQSPS